MTVVYIRRPYIAHPSDTFVNIHVCVTTGTIVNVEDKEEMKQSNQSGLQPIRLEYRIQGSGSIDMNIAHIEYKWKFENTSWT